MSFVEDQIAKLDHYSKSGKADLTTGVRYFSQRDNYTMSHRTCNSSSNAMFLDWILRSTGREGLGGDDGYLRKVLKTGDTIYHENQTAAIKQYGFSTTWRTDDDEELVKALLGAGIPVVVNILHRGDIYSPRGGHIIVLVGRRSDEKCFIAHDPYGTLESDYSNHDGAFSRISYRDFDARWQGGYRVMG